MTVFNSNLATKVYTMQDEEKLIQTAKRLNHQAAKDVLAVVKSLTKEEKDAMPTSAALVTYLGAGLSALATVVRAEIANDVRHGAEVEAAMSIQPTVIRALMEIIGGTFEVKIQTFMVNTEENPDEAVH